MLLKELITDISTSLGETEIKGVTADSREVQEGYAYICIVGTVSDGHNF